jgi:hypothetical protein
MPKDLPLFGWAGWACAVANSHPAVLWAVPSNTTGLPLVAKDTTKDALMSALPVADVEVSRGSRGAAGLPPWLVTPRDIGGQIPAPHAPRRCGGVGRYPDLGSARRGRRRPGMVTGSRTVMTPLRLRLSPPRPPPACPCGRRRRSRKSGGCRGRGGESGCGPRRRPRSGGCRRW